jgi:hypothetical protein
MPTPAITGTTADRQGFQMAKAAIATKRAVSPCSTSTASVGQAALVTPCRRGCGVKSATGRFLDRCIQPKTFGCLRRA